MNTDSVPFILTEREAAQRLRLSVKTLQDWRMKRIGPEFVKFGRAVRYTVESIDAYIRASVASGRTGTA